VWRIDVAERPYYPVALPRVLDPRQWDLGVVGALLLCAATGVAVAAAPAVAVPLVLAVVALGLAFQNTVAVERMGALLLVGGAMTLGYGFANLGVRLGPVPLPITEILLVPLVALALVEPRTRVPARTLLPLCLFAGLVFVRLVFDYPVHGIFAIRDTTMAIEMFIVLIGYRAVARDGVDSWIGKLRLVMLAVILVGLLHPWQEQLAGVGPKVGLQRPVPLFDIKGVKFSVVAAGLFVALFFSGWMRPVLLGMVAGLIGIFQARTLYLMFPITIGVLGWASRRLGRIVVQYVPALAVGVVLLVWAAGAGFQGSEGEISAEFFSRHAGTLIGREGYKEATIEARGLFFSETLDFVTNTPGTIAVGVGLGPDLTFGRWHGNEGQAVRNPHDAYLEVFARTGVLGLSLFLWWLGSMLVPIARRARSGSGRNALFCAWTLAAACVYLGVAAAQPILAFPYGTVPLFFILGMGLAASNEPEYATALDIQPARRR
jgi:hypothetical protein